MIVKKNLTNENSKECFGITNLTSDGKFIPFFDYDNVSLSRIIDELSFIQKNYFLSDVYIIKSNNGYNALTLDKVSWDNLLQIMRESERVDNKFKKLAIERRFFVLRLGNDKKIINILKEQYLYFRYQKSLSHALALNCFYNTDIDINLSFDDNTIMRMYLYKSAKDGYLKVME